MTRLEQAPRISLRPLAEHQRELRPIGWQRQDRLLPKLPGHLARMALLALDTGARDGMVCSLSWAWELQMPKLGVSVLEVPAANVKGRRSSRPTAVGHESRKSPAKVPRQRKNGLDAEASNPLIQNLNFLVRLAGFEPTTPWFVANNSAARL
ncbi:MAG: hypothetical protein KGI90_05805 [Burkholderiales bacterium]|nr:hypothetical protein [Burkholderiales bacterium]